MLQVSREHLSTARGDFDYPIEGSGYYNFMDYTSGTGIITGVSIADARPVYFLDDLVLMELHDTTLHLEYLAANLERGVDRIRYLGFEPSAFNLTAYHNTGIQTPGPDGYDHPTFGAKATSYGNTIISDMHQAFPFFGKSGIYRAYNVDERPYVDVKNR